MVDVKEESLEDEKVDGIPSINVMDGEEQGARTEGGLVNSQTSQKGRRTDIIRNATIPTMAGNLPKPRPNRAIA